MLEREPLTLVLPPDVPRGAVGGAGRSHRARPAIPPRAAATPSFHYVAAGDYWFDDGAAGPHRATASDAPA
ncbi:hypothetical protein [Streptomyces sp. NPDC048606]|uniref:hypothetical protein n=1 Tax=Streptomyces sp. NPDC048606 TaxID=3154726 RepID=UPI0034382C99